MKRLALVILAALTLGITGSASAQFGRNYWLLVGDTLEVVNPNWYIAGTGFISLPATNLNLFIGAGTGNKTLTGIYNIGIGYNLMSSLTTANQNVAIGYACLDSLTSGYNNIAMNEGSLQNLTTGHDNIAIGAGTGNANVDGFSNIALGTNSMYHELTGYQNVAIGVFSMSKDTAGFNDVAVGISTLQESLYTHDNTAVGCAALQYTTEGDNSAFGSFALHMNTTGTANVAIGMTALEKNQDGYDNIAVGYSALDSNVSGYQNTAIGFQCLQSSLASANTALGYQALQNCQGVYNVGVGVEVLRNEYGNGNVAFGYEAGANANGNDMLYIAGHASPADSALIQGDFANDTLRIYGTLNTNGYVSSHSDFSTTTTTLQDVPGLSVHLNANTTYSFTAQLFTSVAASAGEATSVYYGGNTPTYVIYGIVAEDNSVIDVSNWTNTIGTPFSDNTGSAVTPMIKVQGTITTGATAANLTIQYAQSTAQATANVVKRGSWLHVWQTN